MTQAAIESLKTKVNPKTGKHYTDNDIATMDNQEVHLLKTLLLQEGVEISGVEIKVGDTAVIGAKASTIHY